MNLRVFDNSLTFKGEIDNPSVTTIKRKYCDIESIVIKIDKSKKGTEYLVKGAYVYIDKSKNKFFRIYQKIEVIAKDTTELQLTGYSVMKIIKQRITIPPVGQESHIVTGPLETIVKTYIDTNCISSLDTGMNFPFLQLALDQERGQSITDSSRYKNLYTETLRVLALDDIGCKAIFNLDTKKLVFDVYEGNDRTKLNASGNAPVIFSPKYDNILNAKLEDNDTNMQNYAIVAGEGEGVLRPIAEAYKEAIAPSGVDRSVFFVDVKNVIDPTELVIRGIQKIVPSVLALDADINPNSNQAYEVDFDLGDKVTLIAGGLELNTRITEVLEVYQAGKARQVNIVFGTKAIEILDTIKNNSSRISVIETV